MTVIKLSNFISSFNEKRLRRLERRLEHEKKVMELKADLQANSHSLLWVWEFSKKAVLICFLVYLIVQIYSMVTMVVYCDFSHLGDLITQTGEILQNCVFAYLIKAGLENIGKIWFQNIYKASEDDEIVG